MNTAGHRGRVPGETVTIASDGDNVAILTLNRPEALNAMNVDLVSDLHDALDLVDRDDDCRAIVLTGAGKAFCAGLDLKGYGTVPGAEGVRGPARRLGVQQHIASLVTHLRGLKKPVVAAVNGHALGGGFGLALACDLCYASADATFGATFVRVGISGCDIGVSYLLPRAVGTARARELMLTGRTVSAQTAEQYGLVGRVTPAGEVVRAALEVAHEIVRNSEFGVWMTKEVMWSALEIGSLQAAIDLENRTQILATYSGDHAEALRSFSRGT